MFSFLNIDFESLPGDSTVEYLYLNVLDFGITLLYLRKASLLPMEQLLRTPYTGSSARKESTCNVGDPGSIPGSEDPLENG